MRTHPPLRAGLGVLAACLLMPLGAGAADGPASPPQDYSDAERIIFMTEHLGALQPPQTLAYRFSRRGSLKPGVAVTYREMPVGRVTRVELGPRADRVLVHILIEPRYAPLVRGGSRFWNASGIGVEVGLLKGAQIRTESLEAILEGGIAFATPDEARPVQPGQTFALFDAPQPQWLEWAPKIPLD